MKTINDFLQDISENTELLKINNNLSGTLLYNFENILTELYELETAREIKILEFPTFENNNKNYNVQSYQLNNPTEFRKYIKDKIIYIYSIGYLNIGFQINPIELNDINLTEEFYDFERNEYSRFLIFKLKTTLTQEEKDSILMNVQDTDKYINEIKNRNKYEEELKELPNKLSKFLQQQDQYKIKNIKTSIYIRCFVE